MKDFGRWFVDFSLPPKTPEPVEDDLPEGVFYDAAREVSYATCCVCGKRDALAVDLSEIPRTGYEHYCGGSPRCCP